MGRDSDGSLRQSKQAKSNPVVHEVDDEESNTGAPSSVLTSGGTDNTPVASIGEGSNVATTIHFAMDGHSPSNTDMSSLVAEGQGPAADNGADMMARADGSDDPMAGQAASIGPEEMLQSVSFPMVSFYFPSFAALIYSLVCVPMTGSIV